MTNEIAIKVDNVSKNFRLPHEKTTSLKSGVINIFRKRDRRIEVQHALKNISFEIKKGEFFGIVGRNGSGKSTLLKIIAGIYQPTKGKITVNGRLVPFIELGVGFNPELTGRENVFLNGALMGFSKKEIKAKYEAIVDFAELKRFMDQKLKNYSSGMQVRLAFSVATILADSDVLLIDEVLAVGDANFQRKCFEYFRALKKNKKTVVFVSHDMNAVREYCDRAVLIEESRLITAGTPDKIASAYIKMFIEQNPRPKSETVENVDHWGDKMLRLGDIRLSKRHLTDEDEELVINMSVKAQEQVDAPLLGFAIRDSAGQLFVGTNNGLKKQRLKDLVKNETVDLTWSVPNVFSNGRFFVDFTASYLDGSKIGDKWENAIEFEVTKEENSPYVITPNIGLKIEKRHV